MSKQVTPNRLQQAIEELSDFNLPKGSIPKKIHERESLGYVCVGIRSRDNLTGTAKVHNSKIIYSPIGKWEDMEREVAAGRFKGVFNGQFNAVIVLHNPKLPNVKEEKPKVKGLNPKQKSKAKEMKEEGKELLEIALELDVELERVEAYLNK
jgi:hypothetical protein